MGSFDPSTESPFTVGSWTVRPQRLLISNGKEKIMLQPRVMALLQHLAQSRGEVVGHDELVETVWEGRIVEDGAVYQALGKLRKVLGDDSHHPRYIETIPTKGYRLIAPVGPVTDPPPDNPAPGSPSTVARRSKWRSVVWALVLAGAAVLLLSQVR